MKRRLMQQKYECHECIRCFRERSDLFAYIHGGHAGQPSTVQNVQSHNHISYNYDSSTTCDDVENSIDYFNYENAQALSSTNFYDDYNFFKSIDDQTTAVFDKIPTLSQLFASLPMPVHILSLMRAHPHLRVAPVSLITTTLRFVTQSSVPLQLILYRPSFLLTDHFKITVRTTPT